MNTPFRPELFGAAQAFLDYLCLRPEESLVITTDTAGDQAVVQSLCAAAIALGSRPTIITIPQLPFQGKLADPYLSATLAGAVNACDVWIDLTFPYIAGSQVHADAMDRKHIRYMLASDLNAAGLHRMFGNGVLDTVFGEMEAFEQHIARNAGRSVRITTAAGTDVTYQLAASNGPRPRRATEPGIFMIPGACGMNPELESVRGRIVIESVFHEFYTPLRSPLTLEVDGRIRSVTGAGPDRALLEKALLRAGGGQFGYVIHFTHGVHPAAHLSGNCFVEDMRVCGSNAVGLGLPWWVPGGGENHPDAVISTQSVWVDGQLVVDEGRTVLKPQEPTRQAATPAVPVHS